MMGGDHRNTGHDCRKPAVEIPLIGMSVNYWLWPSCAQPLSLAAEALSTKRANADPDGNPVLFDQHV